MLPLYRVIYTETRIKFGETLNINNLTVIIPIYLRIFVQNNFMSKRKYFPEMGVKRGKLTIVSENIQVTSDNKFKFNVQCDCGKAYFLLARTFYTKDNPMCMSCSRKISYAKYHKATFDANRTKYVGLISGTFFSHIKQSAQTRNHVFDITKEFIWELYLKQEGKCTLSGADISLSLKRKKSDPDFSAITASLDRINSDEGYTTDNVQWVHKVVNKMKNNLTEKEFKNWCKLIHDNTEPS